MKYSVQKLIIVLDAKSRSLTPDTPKRRDAINAINCIIFSLSRIEEVGDTVMDVVGQMLSSACISINREALHE